MKLLNRVKSFKTKLFILIVSVTFIVLLVATVSLAMVLDHNFKKNLDNSARSSLAILAYNLAPAVSFGDSDGAKQLLDSFKTSPDVVNASVYELGSDNSLTLLATYVADVRHSPQQDVRVYQNADFNGAHYQYTIPITVEGELIGYLYQHSDFSQLGEFQIQMLGIISITLLVCLLLGVIISLKFQPILLEPLSKLVEATKIIRQQKDYAIRVEPQGKDEFSTLSVSFNHMLDEIEKHNQNQLNVEEEIRQLNLNLEHKVLQRTEELASTNKDLQSTLNALEDSHNQLVEQEKMASLGALVAGIAHEINTPIGVGVTAISHLSHEIKQLQEKFDENKLTQSNMRDFLSAMNKGANISLYNLSRAADIISNFKLIAVDQSSDHLRTLRINDYLHEILLSLNPTLKNYKHTITIECDETLEVYCRAGALVQVITNLVMNSVIHGFEHIEQGHITITASKVGDDLQLRYQDDGCGMSADSLNKLFEPFYTTKRGKGGSGLGAHLLYNLVTQVLCGQISASSHINAGLTYDIRFPIHSRTKDKKDDVIVSD